MTIHDYIKNDIANARELANKKNLRWSVRDVCIEGDTYGGRPTITAHFDIFGTPGHKVSSTELAVDLQNRLSGNSLPTTLPEISNVIFNPPATIVFWSDKTKTVVKVQDGDVFDPEDGLAMAIIKKMYGNTGKYNDIFKKWLPEKWVPEEKNPHNLPKYPWSFDTMACQFAIQRLNETAKKTTKSVKEIVNSLYGAHKQDTGWMPTPEPPVKNNEQKGE